MNRWRRADEKIVKLEDEMGVCALLVVETGSRAYGWASEGSDYDVRFVYARSIDDHMRIDSPREQVELAHDETYDIVGWDLSKFMRLAQNVNPTALEWLKCPVVYESDAFSSVRELFSTNVDTKKLARHYLGMTRADCKRHLATTVPGLPMARPEASVKGLLTTARGVLSLRWVLRNESMPPVSIEMLLKDDVSPVVSDAVLDLVEMRRNGIEMANKPALVGFITGYVELGQDKVNLMSESEPISLEVVNETYRNAVNQAFLA